MLNFQILGGYDHVVLAVSGGADSMALALLLGEYQHANLDFHFTGLTVDHGLRPASKHESYTVHRWFQQRGWRHGILTVDLPTAGNKAANARQARYQAMANWCKNNGVQALLTAHHQLDQAETLCLRLQRGSGVQGLSGMQVTSEQHGITIIRPLLNTQPQALRAYLAEQGQPWFEDASNRTCTDRIQWRDTLAEHPVLTKRLAQTCTNMQRASDAIQHYVDAFIIKHVNTAYVPRPSNKCEGKLRLGAQAECAEIFTLNSARDPGLCRSTTVNQLARTFLASAWQALPEEIRLRVLAHVLQTLSNQPYPPRLQSLERLATAIPNPGSHWPKTLHHCLVMVKNDIVSIVEEP